MSSTVAGVGGRTTLGGTARRGAVRVAVWLAVVAAAFCFSACDSNDSSNLGNYWRFINDSTYTVHVTPTEGQTWADFALAPGETHDVDPDSIVIHYTYSPANHVHVGDIRVIDLGRGTEIHFNNR